jgi:hypothetical protein
MRAKMTERKRVLRFGVSGALLGVALCGAPACSGSKEAPRPEVEEPTFAPNPGPCMPGEDPKTSNCFESAPQVEPEAARPPEPPAEPDMPSVPDAAPDAAPEGQIKDEPTPKRLPEPRPIYTNPGPSERSGEEVIRRKQ